MSARTLDPLPTQTPLLATPGSPTHHGHLIQVLEGEGPALGQPHQQHGHPRQQQADGQGDDDDHTRAQLSGVLLCGGETGTPLFSLALLRLVPSLQAPQRKMRLQTGFSHPIATTPPTTDQAPWGTSPGPSLAEAGGEKRSPQQPPKEKGAARGALASPWDLHPEPSCGCSPKWGV